MNRSDATIKTFWNEILSKGVLDTIFFWNPSQAVFHQVPGPKRYEKPWWKSIICYPLSSPRKRYQDPHRRKRRRSTCANFHQLKRLLYSSGIFLLRSQPASTDPRSQTFLLGTLSRSLQFWVKTPWGWPFNWLFFSGSLAVLGSPKGQDWSLEISGPGTF